MTRGANNHGLTRQRDGEGLLSSFFRRKSLNGFSVGGISLLGTFVTLHYLGRHYLQASTSDLFVGTVAVSSPTTAPTAVPTAAPSIFRKTSGPGWNIWHDSDAPLQHLDETNGRNLTCQWASYTAYQPPKSELFGHLLPAEVTPIPFCIHNVVQDKWVSGHISRTGRWGDCNVLTYWYYNSNNNNGDDETSSRFSSTNAASDNDGWYIDIGANIGSCVIQVLMTTNAKIIAFEPDPRNLFRLTSTLSRLPSELRKRVYVYPVALGTQQGSSEIHVAADNRGNAVVGKKIYDIGYHHQEFLKPLPIPIEVMDELLDASRANIQLVKMDSQGYECYIVQGMRQFLKRTKTILFELEKIMLRSFPSCSETVLWNEFKDFDKYASRPSSEKKPLPEMPRIPAVNLVAQQRIPTT